MPTFDFVLDAIEGTINTGWANGRIAYDNVEPLDYSDVNKPLLSDGADPYIGVKVIFAESRAAETGPNAIRRQWGFINTSFYTREANGAKATAINMQAMADLFEYKVIDDIVFKDMNVFTPVPSEGWYVTPTMLRFYFNR